MFMGKDLLVPGTQVTHDFVMLMANMTMQIWPSQACFIAVLIRAIVSQQQDSVFEDLRLFIADSKVLVCPEEVTFSIIFVPLLRIISKDHVCGLRSAVCTSFRLVQCAQSKGANVAGAVIARRNAVVRDWRCANKAHFRLHIVAALNLRTRSLALGLLRGVFGQASTKDARSTRFWVRLYCCCILLAVAECSVAIAVI